MRCRYCDESAGWWRRSCPQCLSLEAVFQADRGADMGALMDRFIGSGVPRSKIEKFLNADLGGAGTVRDQIAANMTNQVLEALGQRRRQTAGDVERIRRRGTWTTLDRRPPE